MRCLCDIEAETAGTHPQPRNPKDHRPHQELERLLTVLPMVSEQAQPCCHLDRDLLASGL